MPRQPVPWQERREAVGEVRSGSDDGWTTGASTGTQEGRPLSHGTAIAWEAGSGTKNIARAHCSVTGELRWSSEGSVPRDGVHIDHPLGEGISPLYPNR